jgi:putative ABC transport system permease protein
MDGTVTSALTAVDPHTLPKVADIDVTDGSLDDLRRGGVIVAEQVATERGLGVGDALPMTFARTGQQRLPIVGLLEQTDAQASARTTSCRWRPYDEQFSERLDASVYVSLKDGVSAARARKAVEATLAQYPTAELRDHAAAVAGRAVMVDQVLGLVTVLLTFAVGIALLGITNTLALSITERLREIGLLRAVGMTRGQLRAMVRAEAGLIAVLAVSIGVGTGLAFAASTVAALGAQTPLPTVVPVGQLLASGRWRPSAGLLAGLLPARRAARLDVLAAINSR